MIGKSLNFLRRQLDAHLRSVAGLDGDSGTADRVVFVEGDKLEPLSLAQGCISMLVVHLEEERQFRDADRYQRRRVEASAAQIEAHHPDMRLDISLLFVARFKDYGHAWDQLSEVILFFQKHPAFDAVDREPAKEMPIGVSRLAIDLLSMGPEQYQDIWSSLRLSIHPALLYRLRLTALRGSSWPQQPHQIETLRTTVYANTALDNQRSPPTPQAVSSSSATD
ncbi:MAG: Pvc16 family protein [Cyanobium sp.]|jgi:hypothetical protein